KLKKSMFGARAVKHIPKDANRSPPKKAKTGTKINKGLEIRPKAATTHKTMDEFIVARVAPHSNSPAMTSSRFIGVAYIALKVYWQEMGTNEGLVVSKNDAYVIAMGSN